MFGLFRLFYFGPYFDGGGSGGAGGTPPAGQPLPAQTPPAQGGSQGGDGKPPQTPPAGGTPATWEDFIKGQPEPIQTLFNEHTKGLRTALQSERDARTKLEADLKAVSNRLDKDSDARKELEKVQADLQADHRRIDFYEDAAAAGVSNFRLAWLMVQDDPDTYVSKSGRVDFDKLKERNPELFGKQTQPRNVPPGNPGAGTQTPPPQPGKSMNDLIRAKLRG